MVGRESILLDIGGGCAGIEAECFVVGAGVVSLDDGGG